MDIVNVEGAEAQLKLEKQDKVGECKDECKTVQQACRKAVAGKDDKIVSLLKDSAGLAKFHNKICDKACSKKSLPKLGSWSNEEFKEDKDEAINSLMDSMKGVPGMENMKMY